MTINKFPDYKYVQFGEDRRPHNIYRGIDVGFGGYVFGNPGIYYDIALLDAQSLHPNSIIQLNYFGEFTEHYKDILDTRVAIKHGDYDKARKMFDGRLEPYLQDKESTKQLAQALKIALNSCYGLTSAKFNNAMRDDRNVNNIVALRGALVMVDLQKACEEKGWTVVHIKTDSIKLANATPEMIKFVQEFGAKYGYTFEHEATYSRMCLVNDAVYIAKFATAEWCIEQYGYAPDENQEEGGKWTATGAQFQQPYVFKTLFSKEPIEFTDMCETKTVSTALYLDMNEELSEGEHDYRFVGKAGQFTPILPGKGGGLIMREKEGAYYAASGTKGYRWLESEFVREMNKENDVDRSYYAAMVDEAGASIGTYGDFEAFID